MSVGYTFDDTAPVTHSYTACNVGNNPGTYYCFTSAFNQNKIGVGPGQRIVNGKYTMYVSVRDVTAATNTWTFSVGTTCGGIIGTYNIPITNAWPTTAAGVYTVPIDFTGITTAGCGLGLILQGATTADQIRIGYLAFAPVAEQFNAQTIKAQTINATTINLPGGSTGSTSNGCAQSPVTGINNGYTCPTKGNQTTLAANEGASDTTVTVVSTSGFVPVEGVAPYGVMKAAMWTLTRYLASELAPLVRVNALCPGTTSPNGQDAEVAQWQADWQRLLPRVPMARMGSAKESASAVLYLASDMSSYVTGQVIFSDGGRVNLAGTRPL